MLLAMEDTTSHAHNQPAYRVSELSAALKRVVEGSFSHVRVRGEISGYKQAASGHLYFSLKDSDAVLNAVCWRGVAGRFTFAPEDGLEVICTGRLSTYAGRSNYQIVVEQMEPAGVGALMAMLEARRKQLQEEGLFAAERKQPLPFLPKRIGVITSPTGAVIRDILHRIQDRCGVHVLVWPTLVQGEGAAEQVAQAIEGFNALPSDHPLKPDLLMVARGGGSLEDLWAFNEERVVRAIADSALPIISAVGHETDTTLADYAADLRAPTPTAAAEMAVPIKQDLYATLLSHQQRLTQASSRVLQMHQQKLRATARGLIGPKQQWEMRAQRTDILAERLQRGQRHLLERAGHALQGVRLHSALLLRQVERQSARVAKSAQMLRSLDYRQVLGRGYALVRDGGNGSLIRQAADVAEGQALSLQFADGTREATAGRGVTSSSAPAQKPRARRKKTTLNPSSDQPNLFD